MFRIAAGHLHLTAAAEVVSDILRLVVWAVICEARSVLDTGTETTEPTRAPMMMKTNVTAKTSVTNCTATLPFSSDGGQNADLVFAFADIEDVHVRPK
jgi:hypothetical protein